MSEQKRSLAIGHDAGRNVFGVGSASLKDSDVCGADTCDFISLHPKSRVTPGDPDNILAIVQEHLPEVVEVKN